MGFTKTPTLFIAEFPPPCQSGLAVSLSQSPRFAPSLFYEFRLSRTSSYYTAHILKEVYEKTWETTSEGCRFRPAGSILWTRRGRNEATTPIRPLGEELVADEYAKV